MTDILATIPEAEQQALCDLLEHQQAFRANALARAEQQATTASLMRTVQSRHPESMTAQDWRLMRNLFIATMRCELAGLAALDAMEFLTVHQRVLLAEARGLLGKPSPSESQSDAGAEPPADVR